MDQVVEACWTLAVHGPSPTLATCWTHSWLSQGQSPNMLVNIQLVISCQLEFLNLVISYI